MVSGGKLSSATIPCFFRPLFIERKRQGLILGNERPDRVVFETKWLRLLHTKWYESYQLIRMVCVGIVVYQSSSLPFFFFPPITPYYYLSISLTPPLKQINCLRPPRPANTTSGISRKAFCWISADRPVNLYATSPSIVRRTAPTGWPPMVAASDLHRTAASNPSTDTTISHGKLTLLYVLENM